MVPPNNATSLYGWSITIIFSLLAAAVGAYILTDERLIRVEERQHHVIEKLDKLMFELKEHEKETQKP